MDPAELSASGALKSQWDARSTAITSQIRPARCGADVKQPLCLSDYRRESLMTFISYVDGRDAADPEWAEGMTLEWIVVWS